MVSIYLLTPLDKIVANAYRFRCLSLNVRDEQLWKRLVVGGGGGGGWGGIFEPHEFFFCCYFPCMNFFMPVHVYFWGLLGVHEFFSFVLRPPTPPISFLMVCPLFLSCFKRGVVLVKYWRKWKGLKKLNAVLERARVHIASGRPC